MLLQRERFNQQIYCSFLSTSASCPMSIEHNDGFLKTDLYRKDNLKISYLMPSSAHPSHITDNIPYSLAYRLKRICSSDELFEKRLKELTEDLLCRGYKLRSLQDSFAKVRRISRERALERVSKERVKEERVRFVVKFDPRLPNFRDILTRSWKILAEEPRMKQCFPAPPMVCYQRVKNTGEMLVRAKLPVNQERSSKRLQENQEGFRPCKKDKCPVCDQLRNNASVIRSVTVSATGEEIQVKGRLTCSSQNVIYCITCKRGGRACPNFPQYIGETKNSLRERMRGHRGTVIQPGQENTSAPVGQHFRSTSHSICDLEIIPIEQIRQDDMTRKVRESYFIKKFRSVTNGLNIKA